MKIHITARHIELTASLKDYLSKKIERLQRHFDHLVWASAILSVEKHRHIAEIVIHSPLHTMRSKAEAKDLYSAIDLTVDKADKQLKKLKEKWKDTSRTAHRRTGQEFRPEVYAAAAETAMGSPSAHLISVVKQVPIKPMKVEEAIQAMESLGYNFWMFTNKSTKKVNVIFRRADQTYGLMEPSN